MSRVVWGQEHVIEPTLATAADVRRARGLPPGPAAMGAPQVLVAATAWSAAHAHLAADVAREQGGVLVGRPYRDVTTGALVVDVCHAVPAHGALGTPAHLQLTPAAWAHISTTISAQHPELLIVGWYHSHPGLGIFLSATDRATQRAVFNRPWSVALVIDPRTGAEGWFVGPAGQRHCAVQLYWAAPAGEGRPGTRRRTCALAALALGLGLCWLSRRAPGKGWLMARGTQWCATWRRRRRWMEAT